MGNVYTVPRPIAPWGAEHRNVVLDAITGMLVLESCPELSWQPKF